MKKCINPRCSYLDNQETNGCCFYANVDYCKKVVTKNEGFIKHETKKDPQPKSNPMTDKEIEETKDSLVLLTHRSSLDTKVIYYIHKALELIIRFQVESIREKKRAAGYKKLYEDLKKENKK